MEEVLEWVGASIAQKLQCPYRFNVAVLLERLQRKVLD
jgi:hypothetical protein